MIFRKTLLTALFISLAIHGALLFQHTDFGFFHRPERQKKMEVRYIKPKESKQLLPKLSAGLPQKRGFQPVFKMPDMITSKKNSLAPASLDRTEAFSKSKALILPRQPQGLKPVFAKPNTVVLKRKISLVSRQVNKIQSPTYFAHSQVVRKKIENLLYMNYRGSKIGIINISFLVARDGQIKDFRILDESSADEPYLKEIVAQSVKEASPFPPFPKDLDYPELSFSLTVSFEKE